MIPHLITKIKLCLVIPEDCHGLALIHLPESLPPITFTLQCWWLAVQCTRLPVSFPLEFSKTEPIPSSHCPLGPWCDIWQAVKTQHMFI